MWIFIIFLILAFVGIVYWLAVAIVIKQKRAKKEARIMVDSGQVVDMQKAKKVLKTLSTVRNDMEATDLWQRLNKMVNP